MNRTYTTVTLTEVINGNTYTRTGADADYRLRELLSMSGLVYSYNAVAGTYTGTFHNGTCCGNFSTAIAQVADNVTINPITCILG